MKYITFTSDGYVHRIGKKQADGTYVSIATFTDHKEAAKTADLLNRGKTPKPKYSIWSQPSMSSGDKFTITTTTTIGEK